MPGITGQAGRLPGRTRKSELPVLERNCMKVQGNLTVKLTKEVTFGNYWQPHAQQTGYMYIMDFAGYGKSI